MLELFRLCVECAAADVADLEESRFGLGGSDFTEHAPVLLFSVSAVLEFHGLIFSSALSFAVFGFFACLAASCLIFG